MSNAELIKEARAFMRGLEFVPGRDDGIRGYMDRLVAALEAPGPRAIIIHAGDHDDRLRAWNEGFEEAQKQWRDSEPITSADIDNLTWDELEGKMARQDENIRRTVALVRESERVGSIDITARQEIVRSLTQKAGE